MNKISFASIRVRFYYANNNIHSRKLFHKAKTSENAAKIPNIVIKICGIFSPPTKQKVNRNVRAGDLILFRILVDEIDGDLLQFRL